MRGLSAPSDQRRVARLSRGRLAMLAGAALMAPGVLALQALQGQPIDVPVIAGAAVLLFGLTLTRMASLAGEIAAQAERGRLLERLRAVIDASPVAIVELDPDSRVRPRPRTTGRRTAGTRRHALEGGHVHAGPAADL
jgi:PAS domain-containing protein